MIDPGLACRVELGMASSDAARQPQGCPGQQPQFTIFILYLFGEPTKYILEQIPPFWQIYPQFQQNLHQKDPLTIDYPYFYFGAERFDLIMPDGNNTYLRMERVEAEWERSTM